MSLDLPPEVEAAQLEEHRGRFDAGDRAALLSAICFCFDQQIVAPEWVVDAFARATNRWHSMDVKELGEAFGVAWPKGKHLSAAKRNRRLKPAVYLRVREAIDSGRALDDELFDEIGTKLGIRKTLVKELYAQSRRFRMPKAAKMLLDDYQARRKK